MNSITFISWDEAQDKEENGLGTWGGFFHRGMRWKDYLDIWKDEAKPLLEELRQSIIDNHIRGTGADHQNSNRDLVPLFPDGTVATYTYRAWGDLMAAVWSEHENKDYSYMDFYC